MLIIKTTKEPLLFANIYFNKKVSKYMVYHLLCIAISPLFEQRSAIKAWPKPLNLIGVVQRIHQVLVPV